MIKRLAMKKEYSNALQCFQYGLSPGENFTTGEKSVINTWAGKTLVLCFYHDRLKIGGVVNFLVPGRIQKEAITESAIAEYGIANIEYVMADIVKAGGRRDELSVKIFGVCDHDGDGIFVKSNINFIHKYLEMENITILAEDLGKSYVREILFLPQTGALYSKKINDSERLQQISKSEDRYISQAHKEMEKKTRYVLFN